MVGRQFFCRNLMGKNPIHPCLVTNDQRHAKKHHDKHDRKRQMTGSAVENSNTVCRVKA